MDKVDVAGVSVGRLTRAQWQRHLEACVAEGPSHHHVSMNAAKWVEMRRNPALARAVRRATSVAADGIGIVGASRALGTPLPERVPGCDLAHALVRSAARHRWRVALFGARPRVLDVVQERLRSWRVNVVFAAHGYHGEDQNGVIAHEIAAVRPDLVLVALGTPAAELFIDRYAPHLQVPLAMGVGGTFDVWAEQVRRAPRAVQSIGMEWAWRWAGAPRARFSSAVADSARFVGALAVGQRIDP